MVPKTSFTLHAFERFDRPEAQLHLTPAEVAELLDSDRALPLGQEAGTKRVHWLLFSIPNNYAFVVVQDEKTGEVVTVFPVDYENQWVVSLDAVDEAKRLALNAEKSLAPDAQEQDGKKNSTGKS